jgi:hypothetical protein
MWRDVGSCVLHINILTEKSNGMARIGHFLVLGEVTAKQSNCYLYQ